MDNPTPWHLRKIFILPPRKPCFVKLSEGVAMAEMEAFQIIVENKISYWKWSYWGAWNFPRGGGHKFFWGTQYYTQHSDWSIDRKKNSDTKHKFA